jgi:Tfp pilus assembly protein PilE
MPIFFSLALLVSRAKASLGGFTLVQIMIMVPVIDILSAVVCPNI